MTDLVVNDDLKSKFGQFGKIAAITDELQKYATDINTDNKVAGGADDEVAKAYHKQVDAPTNGLSTLINAIAKLFDTTDENGRSSTTLFDDSEQTSTDIANS